ncbi:MAG TPA: hypothetical protein VHT70_00490 [Candidatus Saccharimonadales bacterium]|jgi:hypothetical protein|nr:hypothetical protein [Candidatus Saccharimonadales bacterium]
MSDIPHEFYQPNIPDEILSRGTGEQIPVGEATAFDVMPQLIGSTYITEETELRPRVHFPGREVGSFRTLETAYAQLAEHELAAGNLTEAIDAYRCGVQRAVDSTSMMARFGHGKGPEILMTPENVQDRIGLDIRFSNLEEQLAARIWQGEVSFDPDEYKQFVDGVRQLEKRRTQLHQLFYFGESRAFEPLEAPGKHDPEVGREYIDTCVAMNRYREAARAAHELGWEEAAELTELATQSPAENPHFKPLLDAELEREEIEELKREGSWYY